MPDLYIDTPRALIAYCEQARSSPWIAVDTEFIRERTYYPRLCLIQIADEQQVACIDPLALPDLEPLWSLLYDPAITKVLHSASQDLEIFYHQRGAVPGPVFDTQIAAALLGHGEQVGYATLVGALLGMELDKSQTRTDWSRRPLDAAQLAYAADDVRFLRPVYERQLAELNRLGRLGWLEDDLGDLCDSERYRAHPREMWQRIRGHHQLRAGQLAVLRTLADWREEQAMAADKPRKWIVGDDALLELARHMPNDLNGLQRIRSLETHTVKRHGETLLALIRQARGEPRDAWPTLPVQGRISAEQEALLDALMAVVRLRGAQQGVSPQALASRKDLEQWLTSDQDIPLLHGWRAALAGRQVQALRRGEVSLAVQRGMLCLVED
jgi:ribonuclease D